MVKVSVIVPVYNGEVYLRDCLDSILRQTLDDLEVICVDDGSTDASSDILAEYANRDARIVVCPQENAGLGAARNHGVSVAQGTYLCFLDCDDLFAPEALELLYNRAEKDALDVLYYKDKQFADSAEFEEVTVKLNEARQNLFDYLEENRVYRGCEIIAQLVEHKERQGSVCYQLFNRNFYLTQGFQFPVGIIHEDELISFECFVCADRAGYLSQALYLRRLRSASIMRTKTSFKNAYGYFFDYLRMLEFYDAQTVNARYNEAVLSYMKETLHFAKKRYAELTEEDRQDVLQLPFAERQLFQMMVAEPSDQREELKQLNKLKNSKTYKTGNAVLWLPKKVKGSTRHTS